jgi:hypothetical protein
MPHYFLHFRDGSATVKDLEGSELPDLQAAMNEAYEGARELLVSAIRSKGPVGTKRIEVADEGGTVVGTVVLRDLID